MQSRTAMVYVLVSDLITGNWAEIYDLSNLYVSHNNGVSNGRFGRISSFVLYFDGRFYWWRLGSARTEPINLTNIYSRNQNPDKKETGFPSIFVRFSQACLSRVPFVFVSFYYNTKYARKL